MTRPLDPLVKADRQIRRCPSCAAWVWRGRNCTTCHRKPHTADRKAYNAATQPGIPDDGVVDEVAVERLLNGTLHWLNATHAERLEAGRVALQRDGGYAFCEQTLHLGPRAIRRLRAELRLTA